MGFFVLGAIGAQNKIDIHSKACKEAGGVVIHQDNVPGHQCVKIEKVIEIKE